MKKLIVSMVIFISIIASGLLIIRYFKNTSRNLTYEIENISSLVRENNWEDAKSNIKILQKNWDKTENIWAFLTDHIEIDNIEMSMIKSAQYIESKNTSLSLAELENLKYMVDHIYEKELFNLMNIF